MTFQIAFVLLVAVLAVALFVTEKLRVDVVAILVMVVFLVSGVITPTQGIAGFSNPATVTVAAMFVLAAALNRTGAIDSVATLFLKIGGKSLTLTAAALMLSVCFLSAFINNTAAVAVFLPAVIDLSRRTGFGASKLLIPLSFASLFGGTCTLIGSSTNILVSSLAKQQGQDPFGMFELAPVGVVLAIAGIAYMLLIGLRLLPGHHRAERLEDEYEMANYLTELIILADSSTVNVPLEESFLVRELGLEALEIHRGARRFINPPGIFILRAGDVIRVRCGLEEIHAIESHANIALKSLHGREENLAGLAEAVVAPNSVLVGRSLKEVDFRRRFEVATIALRRRGRVRHDKLFHTPLKAGDVLLISGDDEGLERLKGNHDFVLVSKVDFKHSRARLALPCVAVMVAVVGLAASGVFDILVSSLLGCLAVVLMGALEPDEVYDAIDWQVIMLLGGMLTLGTAMESSGGAKWVAENLLSAAGDYGPYVLLSGFYLLTSLLTEVLSNNATAVLLVPIALSTAQAMQVDPRPFLVAITLAASASFMTPIGYQTNTLVYGPGHYRFRDYLKVGTPLNIGFWLLASYLIPRHWSF